MKKRQHDVSKKITAWVGSNSSLLFHTIFFIGIFGLRAFGFSSSDVLLILTTIVSLEAIYLAIFIQMTINQHSEDLEEVSEDIEELQEDLGEIQEDVEEISEDIEEIQEDVGELQEDVEEMSEVEEDTEVSRFEYIEHKLQALLKEISELKKEEKSK